MAEHTIATVLESAIATLLLLFAAYLLFGSGNRSASARSLAGLCAVFGLSMVLSLVGSQDELAFTRAAKPAIALLAGPALLLYLVSVRRNAPALSRWHWLHLLPAAGGVAMQLADRGAYIDPWISVCTGAYWLASLAVLVRDRQAFEPDSVRRFATVLVACFGIVFILDVVLSVQVRELGLYRGRPAHLIGLVTTAVGSAAIIWMALGNLRPLTVTRGVPSYARSGLGAEALAELDASFDRLMQTDRLFLDEGIAIGTVADRLGVPSRHVSQLVNTRHGISFPAYVNRLRVEEAARRLRTTDQAILDVMFDTGFRSKSTFNREFKRQMGVSPGEWRRGMPEPR